MSNGITSGLVRRLALALTLMVLSAGAAMAQTAQPRRLTLAEAVERARRHHPLIVAAQRRVAMAEADRLESGLKPNPSLTVSGENFPLGQAPKGFDFGSGVDWFAIYTQTFETAGKRRLRISMAEDNLEAARSEASTVERSVVYEVKAVYQRVANARLRLELLRENHNNLNQLVVLNEARVREGYTAEGDLIKARLEARRVEFQTRKANLEYERSRIEFAARDGGFVFRGRRFLFRGRRRVELPTRIARPDFTAVIGDASAANTGGAVSRGARRVSAATRTGSRQAGRHRQFRL